MLTGVALVLIREMIPKRLGSYGGMSLVMIGTLLAAPLFAQLAARLLVPLTRRFFPIEWRLAADNLIRSPGRTGMVIGALAAGVCLASETAGIIQSNRVLYHPRMGRDLDCRRSHHHLRQPGRLRRTKRPDGRAPGR